MFGFKNEETTVETRRLSICLAAYGVSVRFHTECPEMHHALTTFLWPWLPRTARPEESPAVEFTIARSEDGYRLYAGGFNEEVASSEALQHASTLDEAIPMVQNWLDQEFVARASGYLPLHAGAIALGGRAALLPGPSHCGKSTLVRELLRLGCSYYSDEYALLDDDGRLHPYPRALMIRNESGEVRAALAPHSSSHQAHPPATISLILAMQYQPGADWKLQPVDQSSMVITLLKNTPRELGPSTNLFGPIASAVSGAGCYAGIRGDAHEAALRIHGLLAGAR
jgi:hypothetical protein